MAYLKDFHIAVHPGEVLKDILYDLGVSQVLLARHVGASQPKINDICSGKRGISPVMAYKLGIALGQSPEFWMGLQQEWELSQVKKSDYKSVKKIKLEGSEAA